MKNISYVINGILAVAIIILFVLFFTNKNNDAAEAKSFTTETNDSVALLPIAYVNVDSLLTKYEFAKTSSEKLMNKFKSSNASVAQKQRQFESEVADFQKKVQNNAFLSQQRAQEESQRIQKMQIDLQQMAQRLESELAQEEQKMNAQIADSVRLCLKEYNKTAKYHVIFSNNGLDNILIANDKYDITDEIVLIMNNRYKAETTK